MNCPKCTDICPGAGKLQTLLTLVLKQVVQQAGQSYSMIHLEGCDLGWLWWNMTKAFLMLLLNVWFGLLIFWQKLFFEVPCEISHQNEYCVLTKRVLANIMCVYINMDNYDKNIFKISLCILTCQEVKWSEICFPSSINPISSDSKLTVWGTLRSNRFILHLWKFPMSNSRWIVDEWRWICPFWERTFHQNCTQGNGNT